MKKVLKTLNKVEFANLYRLKTLCYCYYLLDYELKRNYFENKKNLSSSAECSGIVLLKFLTGCRHFFCIQVAKQP